MPEDSFDAALVAVRQVSEKLKSLSNDLEKVKSEIDTREKEVESHRAAPLPESDLGAFLLEYVDTTAAHITRALQVQRLLASRSQRGRKVPDLLVAAAAESLGLTVLHYDADFEKISSVTGQPHQWVVKAGSVD